MTYTYEQALELIQNNNKIPKEWVSDIKNKTIPIDIRLQKHNDAYLELVNIMDAIAPIECYAGAYQPSLFIKGFNKEAIQKWTVFINNILAFSELEREYEYDEEDILEILNGALVFGLPIPTTPPEIHTEEDMVNTYNSNEGANKLYQVTINYIQNFTVDDFKILNALLNETKLSEKQEMDACELSLYAYFPAIRLTHNFANQVDNIELFNKTMEAHESLVDDIFSNLTNIPEQTIKSLRAVFP